MGKYTQFLQCSGFEDNQDVSELLEVVCDIFTTGIEKSRLGVYEPYRDALKQMLSDYDDVKDVFAMGLRAARAEERDEIDYTAQRHWYLRVISAQVAMEGADIKDFFKPYIEHTALTLIRTGVLKTISTKNQWYESRADEIENSTMWVGGTLYDTMLCECHYQEGKLSIPVMTLEMVGVPLRQEGGKTIVDFDGFLKDVVIHCGFSCAQLLAPDGVTPVAFWGRREEYCDVFSSDLSGLDTPPEILAQLRDACAKGDEDFDIEGDDAFYWADGWDTEKFLDHLCEAPTDTDGKAFNATALNKIGKEALRSGTKSGVQTLSLN